MQSKCTQLNLVEISKQPARLTWKN